jgi:hypothetical protein
MLFSDSVGGADDRRNGFSNLMPVKVTVRLDMGTPVQFSVFSCEFSVSRIHHQSTAPDQSPRH